MTEANESAVARLVRIAMQTEFLWHKDVADRVAQRIRLANETARQILALRPHAVSQDVPAPAAGVREAEAALRQAGDWFSQYYQQHDEAGKHQKAERNRLRAVACYDAARALNPTGAA